MPSQKILESFCFYFFIMSSSYNLLVKFFTQYTFDEEWVSEREYNELGERKEKYTNWKLGRPSITLAKDKELDAIMSRFVSTSITNGWNKNKQRE